MNYPGYEADRRVDSQRAQGYNRFAMVYAFVNGERRRPVRSVAKAAKILTAFCIERPEYGITELSRHVGMQKTVVYNIAETLVDQGLLGKDPLSRRYRVGLRAYELGQVYASRNNLQETVYRVLTSLRDKTNCTTYFGFLDRGEAFIMLAVESQARIRVTATSGERRPVHATALGKALLVGFNENELDRLVSRRPLHPVTRHTITHWDKLRRQLQLTERRGYSTTDGEMVDGISGIGAPVKAPDGITVGAVSISYPTSSGSTEEIPTTIAAVKHAAAELSSSVGAILRTVGDVAHLRTTVAPRAIAKSLG